MRRHGAGAIACNVETLIVTCLCCVVSTVVIFSALRPSVLGVTAHMGVSATPPKRVKLVTDQKVDPEHHDAVPMESPGEKIVGNQSDAARPPVVLKNDVYHPLFDGWVNRIYPSRGDFTRKGQCVAWRQTGDCDPDGAREPFFDRYCDVRISAGISGFCDCGGGVRKNLVSCSNRKSFVCEEVCSGLAPEVGGAAKEEEEEDDDEVVATAPAHKSDRDHKKKAVPCISWRQTKGCSPRGEREPEMDRPCWALVSDGMSGYCECTKKRRVALVGCSHFPFTCARMCDKTKPTEDVRRKVAHSHFVEDQEGTRDDSKFYAENDTIDERARRRTAPGADTLEQGLLKDVDSIRQARTEIDAKTAQIPIGRRTLSDEEVRQLDAIQVKSDALSAEVRRLFLDKDVHSPQGLAQQDAYIEQLLEEYKRKPRKKKEDVYPIDEKAFLFDPRSFPEKRWHRHVVNISQQPN